MKDLKGVQVHKGKSRPISPDSVDAKMSEIFSLRQKVAQAELSARAATPAEGTVQLTRKKQSNGHSKGRVGAGPSAPSDLDQAHPLAMHS